MKKTIQLTESDIRRMVMEALDELTFTADKLAQMAGKAQGSKKTGLSAIGNKAYNDRKERQRQIFANMAAGAYANGTEAPNKHYDVDNYYQKFDPNAKNGNDFQIRRQQWNGEGTKDNPTVYGAQHGQTMTSDEYSKNVRNPYREKVKQEYDNEFGNDTSKWSKGVLDQYFNDYDKMDDAYTNAKHNQAMYGHALNNTQNGDDAYDRSWQTYNKDESPVVNSRGMFGYNNALYKYHDTNSRAAKKDLTKQYDRRAKFRKMNQANMNQAMEEAVTRAIRKYLK